MALLQAHGGCRPIQLHCGAPSTAVIHPLSVLNAPLVHIGHRTHEVAEREQVRRCSMSRSRWSTALGRGTYGGFVVGQDGQGLLRTLHRQVRRLFAPCLIQTLMAARTHATPHHCTASTARRRDTLECTCCSEGGTVGVCAGNKPVSSPRIGSWGPLYATVFASVVVHEARGHEGTLCTLLPLAAPSGLCCTDVPSSPTGRPDQLAACTGACAPGWRGRGASRHRRRRARCAVFTGARVWGERCGVSSTRVGSE